MLHWAVPSFVDQVVLAQVPALMSATWWGTVLRGSLISTSSDLPLGQEGGLAAGSQPSLHVWAISEQQAGHLPCTDVHL